LAAAIHNYTAKDIWRLAKTMSDFSVVIPARFNSSRLPGKPLMDIAGKPLIHWVWENAKGSGAANVVVATDDMRIKATVEKFGGNCCMTAPHHESGTDRVAEVVCALGLDGDHVVVNVQGDEPLMPSSVIADVAQALQGSGTTDIATAITSIAILDDFLNPNCVKAVADIDGRALYFSRSPIPWPRDSVVRGIPTSLQVAWRHIGIYAYRVSSLLKFSALPTTILERIEKLEQLRALEHGMRIQLLKIPGPAPIGVDTFQDLEYVREIFRQRGKDSLE